MTTQLAQAQSLLEQANSVIEDISMQPSVIPRPQLIDACSTLRGPLETMLHSLDGMCDGPHVPLGLDASSISEDGKDDSGDGSDDSSDIVCDLALPKKNRS
jgi:hypothetical protein